MKKEMDIRLYKYEIIKGKEETAEEWLNFAYLEAYFKTMEGGNLYVYMFFACEDVNFSNDKAINQGSGLDEQHFAYMKECIDLSRGDIMDCLLYLDNMEDAVR